MNSINHVLKEVLAPLQDTVDFVAEVLEYSAVIGI